MPELILGNSAMEKLKKKLTPGMRGYMNLSRTGKSPGARASVKMPMSKQRSTIIHPAAIKLMTHTASAGGLVFPNV